MKKKWSLGLVVGLIAVLVLVGSVRVASAFSGSVCDTAVGALARFLDKTPDTEVARTLASIVLSNSCVDEKLGVTNPVLLRSNESSNFNEVGLINASTSTLKTEAFGFVQFTMPETGNATTTAYFQNKTGGPIRIDLTKTFFQFSGTSSSSVDISMGTSTLSGIATYTSQPPQNLIAAFRLATSTIGSSEQGLAMPTTTKKLAYLKDGEYIVVAWKQPDFNGCTGAFCEAVTSTNRGYGVTTTINYIRFIDSN